MQVSSAPIMAFGGVYTLLMHLLSEQQITVARHGTFLFPSGYYAYAGTAHGIGGLAARTDRHKRLVGDGKHFRWHVDYLREFANMQEIWFAYVARENECVWAQALSRIDGAAVGPMPTFGASDCRSGCGTHLIHFDKKPSVEQFAAEISWADPDHAPVYIELINDSTARR